MKKQDWSASFRINREQCSMLTQKLEATRSSLSPLVDCMRLATTYNEKNPQKRFSLTQTQYESFMWAEHLLEDCPVNRNFQVFCSDCEAKCKNGNKPVEIDEKLMKKLCKIHDQMGDVLKRIQSQKSSRRSSKKSSKKSSRNSSRNSSRKSECCDDEEEECCEDEEDFQDADECCPEDSCDDDDEDDCSGSDQDSYCCPRPKPKKCASATTDDTNTTRRGSCTETTDNDNSNKTIAIKIQRVRQEDLKNFQNNQGDGKIHIPLCSGCFDQSKLHVKVEGAPQMFQIQKSGNSAISTERSICAVNAGPDGNGNDIKIMLKQCDGCRIEKEKAQQESNQSNEDDEELPQSTCRCCKCGKAEPEKCKCVKATEPAPPPLDRCKCGKPEPQPQPQPDRCKCGPPPQPETIKKCNCGQICNCTCGSQNNKAPDQTAQMGLVLDTDSIDQSEISFSEGACTLDNCPRRNNNKEKARKPCTYSTCTKRPRTANNSSKLEPIREKPNGGNSNGKNGERNCCCTRNSETYCYRSDISTDLGEVESVYPDDTGRSRNHRKSRSNRNKRYTSGPICYCTDSPSPEEEEGDSNDGSAGCLCELTAPKPPKACLCKETAPKPPKACLCKETAPKSKETETEDKRSSRCNCNSDSTIECKCSESDFKKRTRVCSSMDIDVGCEFTRLRTKGIYHQNEQVRLGLQEMGVTKILQASRPSKCCRKAILDERQKTALPYVVSLRSLPLIPKDLKVIKKSLKRSENPEESETDNNKGDCSRRKSKCDKSNKKNARKGIMKHQDERLAYYVDLGRTETNPNNNTSPWVIPVYNLKYGCIEKVKDYGNKKPKKTYILKKPCLSRNRFSDKVVCLPHADLQKKHSNGKRYLLKKPPISNQNSQLVMKQQLKKHSSATMNKRLKHHQKQYVTFKGCCVRSKAQIKTRRFNMKSMKSTSYIETSDFTCTVPNKVKKSPKSDSDMLQSDSSLPVKSRRRKKTKELKLRNSIGSYEIGDSSSLDKRADYYFEKLRNMQGFCNRQKIEISYTDGKNTNVHKDIVMEKSVQVIAKNCDKKAKPCKPFCNQIDAMDYYLELVNDKLMFTLEPPQYETYSAHFPNKTISSEEDRRRIMRMKDSDSHTEKWKKHRTTPRPRPMIEQLSSEDTEKWKKHRTTSRPRPMIEQLSSEELFQKRHTDRQGLLYSQNTGANTSSTSTVKTNPSNPTSFQNVDSRKALMEAPWAPFDVSDVSLPRSRKEIQTEPMKNVCDTKKVCQRNSCRTEPTPVKKPSSHHMCPGFVLHPCKKKSSTVQQAHTCNRVAPCPSKSSAHKCTHHGRSAKGTASGAKNKPKYLKIEIQRKKNRDGSSGKKGCGGNKEICELYKNKALLANTSKKCEQCVEKVISCPDDVEILIVDKKIKIVRPKKKNK